MDKMRSYFIWVGALIAVIIVVGVIYKVVTAPQPPLNLQTDRVLPDEWTKGSKDAKVTIIEYGDFECPACKVYLPVVKAIEDEFGDRIQLVFRHFPLKGNHINAASAAVAAEAAGKQGKFWEMHDKLYEKQDEWGGRPGPREFFMKYATDIGLNTDQFKKDWESDELKQKVEGSYKSAIRLGLPGTPSFFLNGRLIKTPVNFEEFNKLIKAELGKN